VASGKLTEGKQGNETEGLRGTIESKIRESEFSTKEKNLTDHGKEISIKRDWGRPRSPST